ncbi:MAG: M12 family metallo-peptidase [Bacteroidetes bacterium]|nr:M12 family metallo-peptidase [Bacteroidota bacterium]MDA0904596.1 M12 family metallo-peptidase [Bacteroidota bacterium]MDA1243292.1 M12 family metallo-peptidase [Bacteroidota bacterium]
MSVWRITAWFICGMQVELATAQTENHDHHMGMNDRDTMELDHVQHGGPMFVEHDLNADIPEAWLGLLQDSERGVLLRLDIDQFKAFRELNVQATNMLLPAPVAKRGEREGWNLALSRFQVHPEKIQVGMTQDGTMRETWYTPTLQTFHIAIEGHNVGTMVWMQDHVMASFHDGQTQWELTRINGDIYALLDANNRTDRPVFECAAEDWSEAIERTAQGEALGGVRSGGGGCVEVALDVDHYTYNTYGNMGAATDWALAVLAGVQAIYTQELNGLALLQASYVHLWQSPDPMAAFNNNAGSMLDNFRNTWEGTPSLDAIQRDITHLLSKRTNTGTGGIAYLGTNCGSFAYGFSANLSGSTSTNINNYSWNLNVVAHELGHNFGSNHTHWCGWPGGPIDYCYSPEGGCGGNVQGQVGTIMSYCHVASGGSVILQFHPTVENNALIPGISNSPCYTGCNGWVPPSCSFTSATPYQAMPCNPATNTYTQQILVTYEYAPSAGLLNVNGTLHTINGSPQIVNLVNQPADGENVALNLFFTQEPSCQFTIANGFTRPEPCCTQFRLDVVNPDANTIRFKNISSCSGSIEGWRIWTAGTAIDVDELLSQGQNPVVAPGESIQIGWPGWNPDPNGDDLQLYSPPGFLFDYIQWGDPYNANASVSALQGFWPGGPSDFVDALPPYTYIGSGGFGSDQWQGFEIPCDITDVTVITASPCDPQTNTFELEFSVTFQGAPEAGSLTVNDQAFEISGNQVTGTLTLPANGNWVNLTAAFEASPDCNYFLGNAIFGPPPCGPVCPEDVNGNGIVDVSDVLGVLSDYGCEANCNAASDINGDDAVTVNDILMVLSAFGNPC